MTSGYGPDNKIGSFTYWKPMQLGVCLFLIWSSHSRGSQAIKEYKDRTKEIVKGKRGDPEGAEK
jgi:hypothetical protein